jgi:APA family basic amino acid/polyamine antiporter
VPAFVLGSFEKLLNYVIFTDMLTLFVVASTLFVLRRRREGEGEGLFRMPGYPVLPAIYMAFLLGVAAHLVVVETTLAIVGTAIFLTGWPLFLLGRRLTTGAVSR